MSALRLDLKRLAIAATVLLVAAAVAAPVVLARPGHGPRPGFRPGGPGFHPRPPIVRPVPPPPRPHYRWHHHRGWDWDWVVAPLAFGATAYGIGALLDSTRSDAAASAAASAASAAQSAAIAQDAANRAQNRTIYWCEGEQGFYPQVRSCPTGWKALPAP